MNAQHRLNLVKVVVNILTNGDDEQVTVLSTYLNLGSKAVYDFTKQREDAIKAKQVAEQKAIDEAKLKAKEKAKPKKKAVVKSVKKEEVKVVEKVEKSNPKVN